MVRANRCRCMLSIGASFRDSATFAARRRFSYLSASTCLRSLQAALVYVNTLTLQDVLADEAWSGLLGEADRRGLTPLFWQHVRPYGEVRLDMGSRLRIGGSG